MLDEHLTCLQANDVPILACAPCVKARRIEEDDFIEGARLATGVDLIRLISDAVVISL